MSPSPLFSLPPDFHLAPSPFGGLAVERGRFHLPLGEMGPELRAAVERLASGGATEEEVTSGVSGLDLLRLHQLLAAA